MLLPSASINPLQQATERLVNFTLDKFIEANYSWHSGHSTSATILTDLIIKSASTTLAMEESDTLLPIKKLLIEPELSSRIKKIIIEKLSVLLGKQNFLFTTYFSTSYTPAEMLVWAHLRKKQQLPTPPITLCLFDSGSPFARPSSFSKDQLLALGEALNILEVTHLNLVEAIYSSFLHDQINYSMKNLTDEMHETLCFAISKINHLKTITVNYSIIDNYSDSALKKLFIFLNRLPIEQLVFASAVTLSHETGQLFTNELIRLLTKPTNTIRSLKFDESFGVPSTLLSELAKINLTQVELSSELTKDADLLSAYLKTAIHLRGLGLPNKFNEEMLLADLKEATHITSLKIACTEKFLLKLMEELPHLQELSCVNLTNITREVEQKILIALRSSNIISFSLRAAHKFTAKFDTSVKNSLKKNINTRSLKGKILSQLWVSELNHLAGPNYNSCLFQFYKRNKDKLPKELDNEVENNPYLVKRYI